MSERHDFSSKTIDSTELESTIISTKSFYSKLNNRKEFEGITDGFYTFDTLRAEFIDRSNILVIWNDYSNLYASFSGSFIMGVRNSLIGLNNLFSIDSPFVYNMDVVMLSNEIMENAGFEMIYNLDPIMRVTNIFNSVEFINNDITFDSSLVSEQLYLLNDWSGSLLSDLDASNLSDMDGNEI